jgi:hypothetical protein
MKIVIIILIYLVGYALSYYMMERKILKEYNYTRGDLKFNLVVSLLSWAGVIVMLLERLLDMAIEDDKIIKKKK